MAVLMLSWIVVAFLFALVAHVLMPADEQIDVDVTIVLGMTGALTFGAIANHYFGQPPWGVHLGGFVAGALGALGGVAIGALGQRTQVP